MLKVACISIGYPNFRYDIAQDNLHKTLVFLKQQPNIELFAKETVLITEQDICDTLDEISDKKPDLFLLELGTYSYGNAILMYLEKFKDIHLVMWSFREPILPDFDGMPLNSLCALNMYTSFLKRMEYTQFSYIYGNADEQEALQKLQTIMKAAQIKKDLRTARFCIVGGRVPGFFLSNVDELRFHKEIGPQISYYSIATLIRDAETFSFTEVEKEKECFKKMVSSCTADEQSLERSARIYLALRKFAQENHINGYAMKCWPDFQDLYQVAVCGVVARLNQEGLLTACEGDVTGLTTMFIQSKISAKTVFLSDLVNVNDKGIVKLWHCGSAAPSLAEHNKYTKFTSHPTMKHIKGVASQLELMSGDVTICKLSEGNVYKLLAVTGQCIEPDRKLKGNQGDIKFDFDAEKLLDLIVKEGIEHHYGIAYDCDIQVLEELTKLLGIRFLTV